jgi:hypothetical protein
VPAGLPDPPGHDDAGARDQADRDRPPEGQHLEIEGVDGAGQVTHGREAGLEHEPGVLRGVEREELGPRAPLGPDGVRLVGVEDADQVDVQVHEPAHDGRGAGVEPGAGPAGQVGHGGYPLDAAPPDDQAALSPGGRAGAVPQPAGQDQEPVGVVGAHRSIACPGRGRPHKGPPKASGLARKRQARGPAPPRAFAQRRGLWPRGRGGSRRAAAQRPKAVEQSRPPRGASGVFRDLPMPSGVLSLRGALMVPCGTVATRSDAHPLESAGAPIPGGPV